MLNSIKKAQKTFTDGMLQSVFPATNLKNWVLKIQPFVPDGEQQILATIKLVDVIYITFKGFNYQTGLMTIEEECTEMNYPIISWRELEDSTLLEYYFTKDSGGAYGYPSEHQEMKKEFHHVAFQGFHVYIDVLCRNVAVEINNS